ncbi:hypothetical protein ACYPKM_04405 [Pseudomonas aeruginosa]
MASYTSNFTYADSQFPCEALLARIKTEARDLKRAHGIKHSEALDEVARTAGFKSYKDAQRRCVSAPAPAIVLNAPLSVPISKFTIVRGHDTAEMADDQLLAAKFALAPELTASEMANDLLVEGLMLEGHRLKVSGFEPGLVNYSEVANELNALMIYARSQMNSWARSSLPAWGKDDGQEAPKLRTGHFPRVRMAEKVWLEIAHRANASGSSEIYLDAMDVLKVAQSGFAHEAGDLHDRLSQEYMMVYLWEWIRVRGLPEGVNRLGIERYLDIANDDAGPTMIFLDRVTR